MKFIALFSALFLIGCAPLHQVHNYGTIDLNEKTVTVPRGAYGLEGDVKEVLSELGWKLSVYRGPSVIEGRVNKETKIEAYGTFNTRYSLYVRSIDLFGCFDNSSYVRYNISFVDNKTGSEVFAMAGEGCESMLGEKFKNALLSVSK
jgi:hypothetical protein